MYPRNVIEIPFGTEIPFDSKDLIPCSGDKDFGYQRFCAQCQHGYRPQSDEPLCTVSINITPFSFSVRPRKAGHKHLCTECSAVIAEGNFDCESDSDHDFEICDGCLMNPPAEILAQETNATAQEIFDQSPLIELNQYHREMYLIGPYGSGKEFFLGTIADEAECLAAIQETLDACGTEADWTGWTVR